VLVINLSLDIQLNKTIISNRIQVISNMIKDKIIPASNIPSSIPFLIHRDSTKHMSHNLFKWNFHYETPDW